MTTRELVLDMLLEAERGEAFSNEILKDTMTKYQYLSKQDRAFITRMFEGVVERCLELSYVLDQYSKVKTKKMKPAIRSILLMGVYQIRYMEGVKDFAAVHESVNLAGKRGFSALKGFVNGVLRSVLRGQETFRYPNRKQNPAAYLSIRYSCPQWLVKLWISNYGEKRTEQMLQFSLEDRALTIRCNTSRIDPDSLKEELSREGAKASEGTLLPYALYLEQFDYLDALPSFQKGFFTVQDESSMLAVHCAGLAPGDQVLDLCAAPGGKTTHAAQILKVLEKQECQPSGFVTARDVSEAKTVRIQENLFRLGLANARAECQDALEHRMDSEEAFDIVLADLPCSGLGVIGRKNDIKYRTGEEDCRELAKLQRRILSHAAAYVKPGGTLIYSTCTLHPAENQENAAWLRETYPLEPVSFEELLPPRLQGFGGASGALEILPGQFGTDGFFFAKYRKQA